MPIGKDYRLTIGAGREELPPAEDREGATVADSSPEPAAVYEALKLIPGAEEIIKEIPGLGDFVAWVPTAYFSVCKNAWISASSCGLRITPMGGMGEVPRFS